MAYYRDDTGGIAVQLDEPTICVRRTVFVDQSGSPVGTTDDSGGIIIPKSKWDEEDSSYLNGAVVRTINEATGMITIHSASPGLEVWESGKTIYIDYMYSPGDYSSDCPNDPAGGGGVRF